MHQPVLLTENELVAILAAVTDVLHLTNHRVSAMAQPSKFLVDKLERLKTAQESLSKAYVSMEAR